MELIVQHHLYAANISLITPIYINQMPVQMLKKSAFVFK